MGKAPGARNQPTDHEDAQEAHMTEYEIQPDDCVDGDGEVWGEHDFPPADHGGDCHRCGAEAEDDA